MATLREFGQRVPGREYRPRPGAYIVVYDARGHVAVIRDPVGIGLPGGGIEPGESAKQALIREAREECGATLVDVAPLAEAMQYIDNPREGQLAKHSSFFTGRFVACEPALADGHDELLWLAPDEALAQLDTDSQRWAVSLTLELER